MQLDRLEAVLRPRSSHEAIDLGFAMVRRWARPVWGAWFTTVIPVWIVILAATWSVPWVGLLLIWWLKPAWERVPLHVLSRALFGATPDRRALLRALPGLWLRRMLGPLTLYRLSPTRVFSAPISQLEGLSGQPALARRRVLVRGDDGTAALSLMLAGLCIETTVAVGLLGMVLAMLPDSPSTGLEVLATAWVDGTAPAWLVPLPALSWLAALTVVEPFVVAGGFALYLNRRTALEGWDVELSFRRIAERVAPAARQLAGLVLGAVLLALPGAARAADGDPALDTVDATVAEVLAGDDFGGTATTETWALRDWADLDLGWDWGPSEGPQLDLPGVGSAIELLLWTAVGLGLVGLIVLLWRQFQDRSARPAPPPRARPRLGAARPAPLPLALPDDPAATARTLWARGQTTEALGVLYASAVERLIRLHGTDIDPAATEGEVLRRVRASALDPARVAHFRALTVAWQSAAYAHRAPQDADFEAILKGWALLDSPPREAA